MDGYYRNNRFIFGLIILSWLSGFIPAFGQETGSDFLNNIEVLSGTFRGNAQRNYYGDKAPDKLDTIWRLYLGKGETVISRKLGSRIWAGAGWTGQPLVVKDGPDTFLIQGAYDHHLRKINAANGAVVWSYSFDDVIKGTGTIWENFHAENREQSLIILQGSRLGVGNYLDSDHIPSFRAVSWFTGKELWRMDVKWAGSYSRDVDASAIVLRDTAYIGLENGVFTVFNPDPEKAEMKDGMLQPLIIQEEKLYTDQDVESHKYNVVTESSPVLLRDHIYVASGSGHVYGYNLSSREIDWDFFIGSDMDGSAVVTSDSCLLISVEKQYIRGRGGVFKLNPAKSPENAVVWYLETGDTTYASWEGGVISTAAINDRYIEAGQSRLAAITAIDGYVYIVQHDKTVPGVFSPGPDSVAKYPCPVQIAKIKTGPSISSPVMTGDRLLVPGYDGLYLFGYNKSNEFTKLDYFPGSFEASPVVFNRRVYIASRGGYLYCLGEKLPK